MYGGRWNPLQSGAAAVSPEDHGTSQICVADQQGNAVGHTRGTPGTLDILGTLLSQEHCSHTTLHSTTLHHTAQHHTALHNAHHTTQHWLGTALCHSGPYHTAHTIPHWDRDGLPAFCVTSRVACLL